MAEKGKDIEGEGGMTPSAGEDLASAIASVIAEAPLRMTISSIRHPDKGPKGVEKVRMMRRDPGYQIEELTATQAFQRNVDADDLLAYCKDVLGTRFSQLNAWSAHHEFSIRITKRGKVLSSRKKIAGADARPASHGKRRILPEGEAVPALADLGIFTSDGHVSAPRYDKYKQINRFLEVVDDALAGYSKKSI